MWNYYDEIVTNNTFDISTNVIESINAKLNNAAGKGNLPFHKAIYVLVQCKTDYIITFVSANVNNALNLIRPATLHRKNTIKDQVQLFSRLPLSEQINHAASFAEELHKELKSPNKELQEFAYLPPFDLSFHF